VNHTSSEAQRDDHFNGFIARQCAHSSGAGRRCVHERNDVPACGKSTHANVGERAAGERTGYMDNAKSAVVAVLPCEGSCVIKSGMQSEIFREDTYVPDSWGRAAEVRDALVLRRQTFSKMVAVGLMALTVMVDSLYASGSHITCVELAPRSPSWSLRVMMRPTMLESLF
jgi:hypothetical protein